MIHSNEETIEPHLIMPITADSKCKLIRCSGFFFMSHIELIPLSSVLKSRMYSTHAGFIIYSWNWKN